MCVSSSLLSSYNIADKSSNVLRHDPVSDIWAPLETARTVASELGVADELDGFLEWESRTAFSVEDKEEGGIVHNWKIPTDRIDPNAYSTETMLSTSFPRLHLLPPGVQVRTLIATPPSLTISLQTRFPRTFDSLWSRLVQWTASEYEDYCDLPSPIPQTQPTPPVLAQQDIRLANLFTILLSLLQLLEPDFTPSESSLVISNTLKIDRKTIIAGGPTAIPIATLGLTHALAKIIGKEWKALLDSAIEKGVRDEVQRNEGGGSPEMEERLVHLEHLITTLQRVDPPSHANGINSRGDYESILDELDEMRARVEKLEMTPRTKVVRKRTPDLVAPSKFWTWEWIVVPLLTVVVWEQSGEIRRYAVEWWSSMRG